MQLSNAEKAYAAYKNITSRTYNNVTTTMLNVLYNVECRIKRDEEYKKEIEAFETPSGESLVTLIPKFFDGYNAFYGLEIRDTLTEFLNPELAEGLYFIVKTYRETDDGSLLYHSPTEFVRGEVAHVKVRAFSRSTRTPITLPRLHAITLSDEGVATEFVAKNSCEISFTVTLSREGAVKFKVIAEGEDEKQILGSETAFGGVLFDFRDIRPTHKQPTDMVEFWEGQVKRLLETDPTDESVTPYRGSVEYAFNITEKNRHKIEKLDKAYTERVRANGQATASDEMLEKYDIYDVNLKSPGPCPVTFYISIPKAAENKSLPMRFIFDGYGCYSPFPDRNSGEIVIHCPHHGYELGQKTDGYYRVLNDTVAKNYGRGNGKINAGYDDITDCYMTYLLLRDLQMVRYCTDPSLSSELSGLHEKWNGRVLTQGGSMGGYQSIAVGALCTLLRKMAKPFEIIKHEANIPAYANISAHTEGKIPTYLTKYEEGVDYYDITSFAPMLEAGVVIPRVGLGDEVCPVTGIVATFNSIPAGLPREINFLQNSSHGYILDPELQTWERYKF
ncbi:MAG: acetylxylan esterase [Clostridia bacterium]|nr:acetylxylan esterase [Clostridia bacterium]